MKEESNLRINFEYNRIPTAILTSGVVQYEAFLDESTKLMALKMKIFPIFGRRRDGARINARIKGFNDKLVYLSCKKPSGIIKYMQKHI